MSGGTIVPRNECPEGHFFQGDSHASDRYNFGCENCTGRKLPGTIFARYNFCVTTHLRDLSKYLPQLSAVLSTPYSCDRSTSRHVLFIHAHMARDT